MTLAASTENLPTKQGWERSWFQRPYKKNKKKQNWDQIWIPSFQVPRWYLKLHNSQLHVKIIREFHPLETPISSFFLGPPIVPRRQNPSGSSFLLGARKRKKGTPKISRSGRFGKLRPFFGFSGIIEIPFWHLLTRWVSTKAQKPKHDQTSGFPPG